MLRRSFDQYTSAEVDVPQAAIPGKRARTDVLERRANGAAQLISDARGTGGEALPSDLREALESHAKVDLGAVRLHHGSAAADAALAADAEAFVLGQDIFFAAGNYRPQTTEGRELIAHEVAHTVQQGSTAVLEGEVGDANEGLEAEADRFAAAFVAGGPPVQLSRGGATPGVLQRRAEPHRAAPHPTPVLDGSRGSLSAEERLEVWRRAGDELRARADSLNDVGEPWVGSAAMPAYTALRIRWWNEIWAAQEHYNAASTNILNYVVEAASRGDEAAERKGAEVALKAEQLAREAELRAARLLLEMDGLEAEKPAFIRGLEKRVEDLQVLLARKGLSIASLAAAIAERADLEHDLGLLRTGRGAFAGAGRGQGIELDCTTFVIGHGGRYEGVLAGAFARAGRGDEWAKVMRRALELSRGRGIDRSTGKPMGLTGIDLVTALKELSGWKAALIVADTDPMTEENRIVERHLYSLRRAGAGRALEPGGKAPGIRVDKVLQNYAPHRDQDPAQHSRAKQDPSSMAFLQALEFGALILPNHVAVIASGVVYEVHIGEPSTEPSVVDATPIERWTRKLGGYQSGVLAAPVEVFEAAVTRSEKEAASLVAAAAKANAAYLELHPEDPE